MRINNINNIHFNDNTVDVKISVSFNQDKSNRWELVDPYVLAVFNKKNNNIDLNYMELIDNGMKVHGFEFTKEESDTIYDYLKSKGIENKIMDAPK